MLLVLPDIFKMLRSFVYDPGIIAAAQIGRAVSGFSVLKARISKEKIYIFLIFYNDIFKRLRS